MNKCGTCKHWGADQEGSEYKIHLNDSIPDSLRACGFIPHWSTVTTLATEADCAADDYTRKVKPEFADRQAFANDSEDYDARLMTTENFGCVHWSADNE